MKRLKEIINILENNNDFLILSHKDPDGDSIGSQLAFYSLLKELGKSPYILNQDEVPRKYHFLKNYNRIKHNIPRGFRYSVVIFLDSPTIERIGDVIKLVDLNRLIVNIDHHPSNSYFGNCFLVDPNSSSTAEIIYKLILKMGIKIGKERAASLYVGILTDTGRFRYPNTTPHSFFISAELIKEGIDPSFIAEEVYSKKSPQELKLLGMVLSTFTISDGVGIIDLTKEMLQSIKKKPLDTEGLADYVLTVEGIKIGLLFKEQNDGKVKVSLRSKANGINVSDLAANFGGGGHETAAGCVLECGIKEARSRVLSVIGKKLRRKL